MPDLHRPLASGAVFLVLSLLIAGCATPTGPRKILECSAMEISKSRTFAYVGRREPRGAFQGQLASVTGDVRIVRLGQDDPLGARVHAAGQVLAPATGKSLRFENAYDGRTFRSLRPNEKTLVEGTPEEGGRALFSDGADGLILEPLIDPDPFRAERSSRDLLRLRDSIIGGEPCAVVEVGMPPASSYQRARWHISLHDWLPRRVEMLYAIGEARGSQVTTAEELRAREPIGLDTFTVEAPPGFEVQGVEAATGLLPVGTAAPDWTLKDPQGDEHRLSSMRGRVVVLDFWATWCGPCRAAMPAVQAVHDRFASRPVSVFGVAFMERGDPARYMHDKGFTYTLLLDGDAVGAQYGVTGIPVFVVIDPQGVISYRHVGSGEGIGAALTDAVEAALAGTPRR